MQIREQPKHVAELFREQLAEDGTDIHAGKKIARAACSLGRAGVIAVLWMVERDVHELGEADWPVRVDASGNQLAERIHSLILTLTAS